MFTKIKTKITHTQMHFPAGRDRSLMIILLVAYILRESDCAEEDGSTTANANADSSTQMIAEQAPSTAQSIAGQASSTAQSIGGQLSSVYESCKDTVVDLGTQLDIASKELLKGFSRLSLALFGITVRTVNAGSHVVAETGNAVNTGYTAVTQPIGNVPVIGTITNGVQIFIEGVTDTFDDCSKFVAKQCNKMVTDMRADLNEFNPQSGMKMTDNPTAPAISNIPASTNLDSTTPDSTTPDPTTPDSTTPTATT